LFNAVGTEVASITDSVSDAYGTCGFPGEPRVRRRVVVTSTQPVAFAIMDVVTATEDKVFVIDNFKFFSEEKPSAIELISFTAMPGAQGVTLAWETASEIDNEGFNLWRSTAKGKPYTKINKNLVVAKGDAHTGATYSYLDAQVSKGMSYYYKLENVDIYGVTAFYGPVSTETSTVRLIYLPLIFKERK
jgi:hypothetical protein